MMISTDRGLWILTLAMTIAACGADREGKNSLPSDWIRISLTESDTPSTPDSLT